MDGGGSKAEAELREAMAALVDVVAADGDAVGPLAFVGEWLDLGELTLAFEELVAIAGQSGAEPDVWRCLQRAHQHLGRRPGRSPDPGSVATVDAMVERAIPLSERPDPPTAPSVLIRGGGRIGPIRATWPLASMEISVDEVVLKVMGLSRDAVRRANGGQVILKDSWGGPTFRLRDDAGRGGVVFGTWNGEHVIAELRRFGWGDALVPEVPWRERW